MKGKLGCLVFVVVLLASSAATIWVLSATQKPEAAIGVLFLLGIFVVFPVGMATGAFDDGY